MIAAESLSLANLEAYDGEAVGRGAERRYLCPLCGDGKPRDAAHRCLCANTVTGAWNCKRCKASGKLKDFWVDQPREAPHNARRARLRRAFDGPTVGFVPKEPTEWRKHLDGVQKLDDTPGASYLAGRGIALEVGLLAGVRYSPRWYGRRAVVFPIRNQAGDLVAAQGRAIDSADKLTAGPKSHGIFTAHGITDERFFHAFDKRLPAIILTEAPIDALSLAACGFPALALCGATGPTWLHRVCGLRRVLLATDADEAGDNAATNITATLAPFGAQCERLRPDGAKDWNALFLQIGRDALSDWLAMHIFG
jgi:hypothetical protein